MKVTRKNPVAVGVTYGSIRTGESFRRDSQGSKVFIKTDRDGISGKMCVDLKSGVTYSYSSTSEGFHRVDSEVVVHG